MPEFRVTYEIDVAAADERDAAAQAWRLMRGQYFDPAALTPILLVCPLARPDVQPVVIELARNTQ